MRNAEVLACGRVFVQCSIMQFGSERSENQSSTESLAAVSMAQLASVAAGCAEGFSLQEVLEVEGLDVADYRNVEMAYKRLLLDPVRRERLAENYQKELASAEDRLARKISPIDEDIDAWVRFLGAYGAQSAPGKWLATIGLTLSDLSRLSRLWKQRFESDEDLGKRAEKSAKDKKPYDISSLQVSPAKLVPSPLAKPRENVAIVNSTPFAKPTIPHAGALADSSASHSVAANLGIAFRMPQTSAVSSALAVTAPIFVLPNENVLPFVSASDIPDEKKSVGEFAPTLASPREALSGTSLTLDISRGPITPFDATNLAKDTPDKPKPIDLPLVKNAPLELSGTSPVVEIPRGPAVPFVKSDKPASGVLVETSLAVEIPRGPAVPFVQTDKSVEIDSSSKKKESAPDKPASGALRETSLAVEIPRGPAVPFVLEKQGSKTEPMAKLGNMAPQVPIKEKPTPLALTLEQHAAMSVEIATYPNNALAILKRYGLTPPQKVDLDKHYQRIVASDPAKQAAWHAAYRAHYAVLMRAHFK